MSKFLTSLDVILVDGDADSGRGLWELQSPLMYESDVAELVINVPTGFRSDYASVPRVPVAFLLFGDTATQASVVHDFLYSTGLLPRAVADSIFREASMVTGVPKWRAWGLWLGVRVGGAGHYSSQYTTK